MCLQLSLNVAKGLSEVASMELGLANSVTIQQPKIIDETKEPLEFFQGTYVRFLIDNVMKNLEILKMLTNFLKFY